MTSANLPPSHPTDAPVPTSSVPVDQVPLDAPPVEVAPPPVAPQPEPSETRATWLLVFSIISGLCTTGPFWVLGIYIGATGDEHPGAAVAVLACTPLVGPLVGMLAGLTAASRRSGPPRVGGVFVLIGSLAQAVIVLAGPFVFFTIDDDPMLMIQIILLGGLVPGLLSLAGSVMGFLRPRSE